MAKIELATGRDNPNDGISEATENAADGIESAADFGSEPSSGRQSEAVAEEEIGHTIEPGNVKKRRGRRSRAELEAAGEYKPRNADSQNQAVKISKADLAKKISGAHMLAAMYTGLPLIQLQDDEAESMAAAFLEVAKYHSVKLDGKVFAWVQLLGTMGIIYGTRVIAFRHMRAEHAAKIAQERQQAELFPET